MADRYWVAGGTGNYNSTTNWSATSGGGSGASVPGAADNVFFNAASGTGIATITSGANCANLNLTGFSGTLNVANFWQLNGTIFNLGLGTYTITGTSKLRIFTAMTVTSNGTTFTGNIEIATALTATLADNFTCSGTFEFGVATGTWTLNGNTLNISGNLLNSGGATTLGTTAIVFNGTGTWSHTNTGVIRNNVTINTAGTLIISGNVYYNTGALTYVAGTVVTTGSTLNIALSTTLNTNGITWNNITYTSGNIITTLGSNLTLTGTMLIGTSVTCSFTLGAFNLITSSANLTTSNGSIFNVPQNLTFKTFTVVSGSSSLNANTLTITENLTMNGAVTSTTNIVYAGTGTWTASSVGSIITNNFTINTAGTLTITGVVYKGAGTFTYTAGTIVDTGATVVISSGSTTTLNVSGKTWEKLLIHGPVTLTSNINAITFGSTGSTQNTTFTLGGNTLNFTHLEFGNSGTSVTLPTAWVCQNITFVNIAGATINGNSITINGNINQNGGGTVTGTTTFTYAGTGTWSRTGNGYFTNSFTINTAGILTFSGGSIGGGIFTYTAGTINILTGSILYNNVSNTTFNDGSIVWYDVVFGLVSGAFAAISSVVLNDQLVCSNTLRISAFNITYLGTNGTFDVYNLILQNDTNNRSMTLISTKTYRVRQSLTAIVSSSIARFFLGTTIPGSQAIFTVDQGATIDVGFVNATDINSSLGRPIYSYRGVFSNTSNWNLLPTDVTPKVNTFAN